MNVSVSSSEDQGQSSVHICDTDSAEAWGPSYPGSIPEREDGPSSAAAIRMLQKVVSRKRALPPPSDYVIESFQETDSENEVVLTVSGFLSGLSNGPGEIEICSEGYRGDCSVSLSDDESTF